MNDASIAPVRIGLAGLGTVGSGLVAVLGTQYTQALRVDWVGAALAVGVGALSSAVLVASIASSASRAPWSVAGTGLRPSSRASAMRGTSAAMAR